MFYNFVTRKISFFSIFHFFVLYYTFYFCLNCATRSCDVVCVHNLKWDLNGTEWKIKPRTLSALSMWGEGGGGGGGYKGSRGSQLLGLSLKSVLWNSVFSSLWPNFTVFNADWFFSKDFWSQHVAQLTSTGGCWIKTFSG